MFKLNNKVALVTGGASGIGLAISKTFAEQGAYVHILEINEAEAQSAAQDIRNNGGNAEAHFLDVSKQNEVNTLVKSITDRHRIDILVNNAGISHIGKVHTTTEDDFDRLLTVNVKGPYNMLHAVIPHFLEQGGGVILNMASIAATVGLADRFAYSTTKGAVYTMTISVARDYIWQKIIQEGKLRCFSNCRPRSPLEEWQNPRKLVHWHYIYVQTRLPLLQAVTT
jgi:2-keto-3-deoxy-L-fuconate dehydrogenase